MIEIEALYRLSIALLSLHCLISSAEYLSRPAVWKDGGIISYEIAKLHHGVYKHTALLHRVLACFLKQRGFVVLLWVRIILSFAVIGFCIFLDVVNIYVFIIFSLVAFSQLLLQFRFFVSCDGSDQMFLVVAIPTCVGLWALSSGIDSFVYVSSIYIAIQSFLSYFCSGVAKSVSPEWRNGEAINHVMGHVTYGNPIFYRLLQRYSYFPMAICWIIIVTQIFMPAFGVLPNGIILFLIVGSVFHLGIAIIMGLNLFTFSFLAAYPHVALLNMLIHGGRQLYLP